MGLETEGVKYRISLEDYFSKGILDAEHHGAGFERRVDSIGEHLSSLKNEILGAFGVFAGFEFFKGAAESFIEDEKAAQQLKFAISAHGGLTSDFEKLHEQAEKLEHTGIFDRTETEKAAQSWLNFGISVRGVRDNMKTLQDVAAQKGGGLEEVANLIATAAAQGRGRGLRALLGEKTPVLEKAEGVDELGNHIKNAGAEARNFTKIIAELKAVYGGGLEDITQNTEFGKLANLKNQFEEFKKDIGSGLMQMFNEAIPSIRHFIDSMREVLHWVRENWTVIKNTAVALGTVFIAFKAIQSVVAIISGIRTAWLAMNAAIELATVAEATFSAVMAATPWGLIALGIGGIAAVLMNVADSAEAARKKNEEFNKSFVDDGYKKESERFEDKIDELLKSHPKGKLPDAQLAALAEEQNLIQNALDTFGSSGSAGALIVKQIAGIGEVTKKDLEGMAKFLKETQADMNRQKLRGGGAGDTSTLGSELSEPKASKIQNVTINLNQPFQYAFQNMKSENPVTAMEDIGQKITEYLVSLVTDAAIVSTE